MAEREIDSIREHRIDYEIVVDAYKDDTFTANMLDIEAINPDLNTQEALADWQYWSDRGYGF